MAEKSQSDEAESTPSSATAVEEKGEEKKAAPRKVRGSVFINEERCKGCGLCIAYCPSHVLERSPRFNPKGYHPPEAVHPDDCTGCDMCGYFCPDYAIYGVRLKEK